MENSATNFWDLIVAATYASSILIVFFVLKKPISSVLKTNNVKITLPIVGEISISPSSAGIKISAILNEFKNRFNGLLNEYEKDLYRKILRRKSTPQVKDLIPEFSRENKKQLGALRALRGLGLVIADPVGEWSKDSYIIITKFGRELEGFLKGSL